MYALNNSSHAAASITEAATTFLGAGLINTVDGVYVDSSSLDQNFNPALLDDAINSLRTNYRVTDQTPGNHATYRILSNPFAAYSDSIAKSNYAYLENNNLLDAWACSFVTPLPAGTQPGIRTPSILSAASAPANGIEFGMSTSYKGWNTSSPSATVGLLTGCLLALRNLRQDLNALDVIGALRQTANAWSAGYAVASHGYGMIDYDAALVVASIYLQPPMSQTGIVSSSNASVHIYPFRQTRRAFERTYLASTAYAWPVKDEYTQADIDASGATLIGQTNGATAGSLLETYPIAVAAGAYHLIVFTCDGLGSYSRVESFCKLAVTVP